MPGMSSPQTRDFGAEQAAAFQRSTYESHGHLPGSCVGGPARKQGYADPQVNGGTYQYAMSHGDGSQGVHSATGPTPENTEFGQGNFGDTTGGATGA